MAEGHSIRRADRLDGESERLAEVLGDLSDHGRMRDYARWLSERDDARGPFLLSVLEDWDAGKDALADDPGVDPVWRDACGVTLLRKLREGKLDPVAAAILSAARPALKLTPTPTKGEVPVGATKFGGKPDLDAAEWPEFEGRLHTFLGQFRLDDLRETQAGRLLPGSGLLSFFVFDDPEQTGQPAAEGAEGAWRVIYTPDVSRLRRREPPKAFDEGNRLAPECVLRMEETLDLPNVNTYELDQSYADGFVACRRAKSLGLTREHGDAYEEVLEALLPDREQRSHLFGWSHPQVASDDPVDDGFRHLLTVASEEALEWCWADGHQLFFSLRPDDLAASRFERTAVTDG